MDRSSHLLRSRGSLVATFGSKGLTCSLLVAPSHPRLASGDVISLGVSSLLSIMEGAPRGETVRRGQNSPSSCPVGVMGRPWDKAGVRVSSLEPGICRDDEVHFLIHTNNNKFMWGRYWTCGQFRKEVSQPKHL